MNVVGIDHAALYTDHPERVIGYFRDGLGFACSPLETTGPLDDAGQPETASVPGVWPLTQGDIRIFVTAATQANGPVARYVARHGDGIGDLALGAVDAAETYHRAVERGARSIRPPAHTLLADGAAAVTATVAGPGDLTHTFVQRLAAGTERCASERVGTTDRLLVIDHVAICLPNGSLARTTNFYTDVFGFGVIFEEQFEVGDQAIDSKVVQNAAADVTFTLIEPDTSRAPGQIDRFLADHDGPGVQHLAFLTEDIVADVAAFRANGVSFLKAPESYYAMMGRRMPELANAVSQLSSVDVLADRDHWGHLLQIFTQSPHPRTTLFYELIERRQARTFGSGNVRALYEAVEHDKLTAAASDRA
ncbi:4-hydroxyphenylpyruvate dioxygenase [Micromonospora sp. LOL_021]|uniref:4-hydroxyphenylpyruvate dioxygenase n=1 Tax=Micromonospora sp. LOL_021 TaxID=3345417 RepID=UPI003A89F4E8